MRDSILIYRSQIDALRNLPAEQFKAALLAIAAYGMDGVDPEGDPVVVAMVGMVKPLIDKNNKNFENGLRGGRPPKTQTENRGLLDEKPNHNRTEPNHNRMEPNHNRMEPTHNPKEKGERRKEKDLKENTPNGVQKKSVERFSPPTQDQVQEVKPFHPPTQEEVQEYVSENGYNVDASRFVDYYKSKGWMVGKTKMKDWKAAVRNWSRSEGQRQELTAKGNTTTANRFNNFPAREYDYDELERQLLSAQTRGAS